MSLNRPLDEITNLLMQRLGEVDDPKIHNDAINAAEKLHVMLIVGFIVRTLGEHQDHEDCFAREGLPKYIEECKADFAKQLDHHIELNLLLNGLSLHKTHNQEVMESILAQMKEEADAIVEDSYTNYDCPICGAECTEDRTCGCERDVNLPKD